jgi:predicted nucleotidyltransferase component of viral defense system
MTQHPKNIPASIYARLTNEAQKTKKPFIEILQYYGIERFLYRLSQTQYANAFVLKGGLVFYSWELPLRRPTKDIDFLGLLENRKEVIDQVIKTALSISVPEDGMNFDSTTLSIVETQVDANQSGIRAKFTGYLNKTRIPIQIDLGFSDEISSVAQPIDYPTLLAGMSKPRLISYPIESVVAEKFHAMERFALVPSRWKDYYDIWLISNHFEFVDTTLQAAIITTFENRSTPIPTSRPNSLNVDFATKHDKSWKAFLKSSNLENEQIDDLAILIEKLWTFLEYPLQTIVTSHLNRKNKYWLPNKTKWQ